MPLRTGVSAAADRSNAGAQLLHRKDLLTAFHRSHHYPDVAPQTLVALLPSSDASVRWKAAHLLGKLDRKRGATIAPALLKAIDDADQLVHSQAIHSLLKLGYPFPQERLLSLLHDDPDQRIRSTLIEAIGYLNNLSFLPELEKAFQQEKIPAVRAKIIRSIGLIASPEYLPKLERYLSLDAAPAVQRELLAALYRLGDRTQLESLLRLLVEADAKKAWSILFTLQYLVVHRPPASLHADSAAIRKAVTHFTARLPVFSLGVQPLLDALTTIENQS